MDVFEFAAMIEETPIRSRVVEYSDDKCGALIGVSLTDVLSDVLSMVYSFYAQNMPEGEREQLAEACDTGNSSVYGTGIHPGHHVGLGIETGQQNEIGGAIGWLFSQCAAKIDAGHRRHSPVAHDELNRTFF